VNHYSFKDRDGQTSLPLDWKKDLIPTNIETMGELDEVEEQNIASALVWLEKRTNAAVENIFWRKLHGKLLGNVWRWAGKIRIHPLQNEDFFQPGEIWPGLKQLEDDLKFWADSSIDELEVAAMFHERLLTIHPFANGNGRFSRIVVAHYCARKELKRPTWGQYLLREPQQRRATYIAAVMKARHEKNYTDLIHFMCS
jgi:fido (protein-threonine AMPylation protein)